MDDTKKLVRRFMLWRGINWALISLMVIRAISALTWLLPSTPKTLMRMLVAIAIISYSVYATFIWSDKAEEKEDRAREAMGQTLVIISTMVIVTCRLLRYVAVLLNLLTVGVGAFWMVMIGYPVLAGCVWFSVAAEKHHTDKNPKVKSTRAKAKTKRTTLGRGDDGKVVIDQYEV